MAPSCWPELPPRTLAGFVAKTLPLVYLKPALMAKSFGEKHRYHHGY
jgi:hypothetical protein